MNIQTIHTKNLRWIDITSPGPEEIKWLKSNFRLHDLHFKAVAEQQQRPHIEEGLGYDFLVLLFPVYNRETQEIYPGEVDFIIGEKLLITVHYDNIKTIKYVFNQIRNSTEIRNEHMRKGAGFLLYKVLENLFRRSYPILDHMNEDLSKIESKIFHQLDKNMVYQIAMMRKNIIEFRKMMKTHSFILEKLPKKKTTYLTFPQSKIYYKDLLEYSTNIWDILEAFKETTDTLSDTTQSLGTHRLNELTKVISIFSVILLPATLIAFIFGLSMEDLPFRDHPYGFWVVIGIMVEASLLTYMVFKHQKWF